MTTNLPMAIKVVHTGLRLLTSRLITVLVLLFTAGAFAWCLYDPRWERIVAASLFALFGLAICRTEGKEKENEQVQVPE